MILRHINALSLFLCVKLVMSTMVPERHGHRRVRRAPAPPAPSNLNASLAALCTPTECLQGANTLSAGVTVYTPSNSSSRATVLLPGTYTPSAQTTANTSLLAFSTTSTSSNSVGFTSSGQLGSVFTVGISPGLVAFETPLFGGQSIHHAVASPLNLSTSSSISTSFSSFLLSSNLRAILRNEGDQGNRIVAWTGIADVSQLKGGGSRLVVESLQSTTCTTPCSSRGVCMGNGTCSCQQGFTGNSCNSCADGFWGRDCLACPAGCTTCDQGITGSGRCLEVITLNNTAAACNCVNGVCASGAANAQCSCNAGWATANNGTQCAACAPGYFETASGDCLACDPSCASCTSPTGTCLTCQTGLQPLSTDPTKCTTATTATQNGTFITCPSRTFFDTQTSTCVDCNPLCEKCFQTGTQGCLECRKPNVLLNGNCVAVDAKTGLCDSRSTGSKNGGWVYDNAKGVCDALPARCTAGGINNFNDASTRAQLTCSACLPGTVLLNGACIDACPAGTTVSSDEKGCSPCDPTCATCSASSTSGVCLTCSDPSKLVLNGTCIPGPTCPAGFFAPTGNSTCLQCHPDCVTCGTTFDHCLTCPSSRPVLSPSGTCLETCSSNEYLDNTKGTCVTCSGGCATCSGASSGECTSCASNMVLKAGSCVPANCQVIDGFGVCLQQLVAVGAQKPIEETKAKMLPWWTILLIILCVLALLAGLVFCWRRRERKRRLRQTARFANNLGKKEVELKLQQLSPTIANPPLPLAYYDIDEVPLTPRIVVEHHHDRDLPAPPRSPSAWSISSYGSKATIPSAIRRQYTGASGVSGYSAGSGRSLTSNAGKKVLWGDKNPFK